MTVRKYLNSQVPPLNPEAIPKAEQTGGKKETLLSLDGSRLFANEICRIYSANRRLYPYPVHINAFGYFGGYPQELLYDNITQIVKKKDFQ